jgi:hypothetical protein
MGRKGGMCGAIADKRKKMKCYLCGRFCDKAADGLCPECIQRMNDNNQRVHILGLLKQAEQFCPVRLREEIEKVIMPCVKLDP